jgi:hypothetical protein
MKKSVFFAILIVIAAGAFAQERQDQDRRRQPPVITVTGTLSLVDGKIALENDTAVYYVAGLEKLIGFIDGLKEGAGVTLEGFAKALRRGGGDEADKERQILRVSRLTLNGKSYDLSAPALAEAGPRRGFPGPGPGYDMMMNRHNRQYFRDAPGPWTPGPGPRGGRSCGDRQWN